MKSFFNSITEQNKTVLHKPADSNVVYYSELNEWFTDNAFRSFSLKYVIDECIHYKTGNQLFSVDSGHFMIANKQPEVRAYFHGAKQVRSICIDIVPEIINEAFTILSAKDDYKLDDYLCGYFDHPNFFESVSSLKNAFVLNAKLGSLVESIQCGTVNTLLDQEWFLDLAEKIICHEHGNYLALNGIYSVKKQQTKKQILHRLTIGKQYMDDCFLSIESIAEIAKVCCLSEFHFFRAFRQAYGITPYKYLLRKRLEHAKGLFKLGEFSVDKVAVICNFADLPTFSKAFKREFGIAPRQWQWSNMQ